MQYWSPHGIHNDVQKLLYTSWGDTLITRISWIWSSTTLLHTGSTRTWTSLQEWCTSRDLYSGTQNHKRNGNSCTNRMICSLIYWAPSIWKRFAFNVWCRDGSIYPSLFALARPLLLVVAAWAVFYACWNILFVAGAAGAEYNTSRNSKCPWNKIIRWW